MSTASNDTSKVEVQLSDDETAMRNLLSANVNALENARKDGLKQVQPNKTQTAQPDISMQKKMKPFFKEWLHIKFKTAQEGITQDQIDKLVKRCGELVKYITDMQKNSTDVGHYCKGFVNWLLEQVKKTQAELAKSIPPDSSRA